MIDDFVKDTDKGDAAVKRMWIRQWVIGSASESQKEEGAEQKPVGQYDDSAYIAYMNQRIKIHEDMIKQNERRRRLSVRCP